MHRPAFGLPRSRPSSTSHYLRGLMCKTIDHQMAIKRVLAGKEKAHGLIQSTGLVASTISEKTKEAEEMYLGAPADKEKGPLIYFLATHNSTQ